MNKIYFLRNETDYGPFFSSKKKVIEYLSDDYGSGEIEQILNGKGGDYPQLMKIELNDPNNIFDG